MGLPTNIGLRILEAGDSCGDEVSSAAEVTGDSGGREEDDSPGPDVRARLEGRALLTLLRGTSDGPEVPSMSDNVGIPEAPQILPLGPVMVQELGPELGPLSRAC